MKGLLNFVIRFTLTDKKDKEVSKGAISMFAVSDIEAQRVFNSYIKSDSRWQKFNVKLDECKLVVYKEKEELEKDADVEAQINGDGK